VGILTRICSARLVNLGEELDAQVLSMFVEKLVGENEFFFQKP